AMLFFPQQLVGRLAVRREPLRQPSPGSGLRDGLIAQAVEDFDHERGRRLDAGRRALGSGFVTLFDEARGKGPGRVAFLLGAKDLRGQPAKSLDQRQPQHDRNRPELADRERRDVLIGIHEAPQNVLIEPSGRVRDEVVGDDVHPRVAPPASVRQRRQLVVVLARKISTDFLDLRADDVVIVAEPLLGRSLHLVADAFLRELPVHILETAGVPLEARQQLASRPLAFGDMMARRQFAGVRLELVEGKRGFDPGKLLVELRQERSGIGGRRWNHYGRRKVECTTGARRSSCRQAGITNRSVAEYNTVMLKRTKTYCWRSSIQQNGSTIFSS